MSTVIRMTRAEQIALIAHRDGPDCFLCHLPFETPDLITFDHWIPQSKGGTWDIENLRLAHKRCNALKGDRMPNPDGTLPSYPKELNSSQRRAIRRSERVEVCQVCTSGRGLGPDEVCDTCGSTAMPPSFPQWAKLKPSECSHESIWWCWACMSGVIERQPAIYEVLDADESLD